jgi:hypothetical protein
VELRRSGSVQRTNTFKQTVYAQARRAGAQSLFPVRDITLIDRIIIHAYTDCDERSRSYCLRLSIIRCKRSVATAIPLMASVDPGY